MDPGERDSDSCIKNIRVRAYLQYVAYRFKIDPGSKIISYCTSTFRSNVGSDITLKQ